MAEETRIALLRGINVGGRNIVQMKRLRELCGEVGWRDVRSYIQSGNVVFRSTGTNARAADDLESAIEGDLGFRPVVVVRSAAEWREYRRGNPFPEESESLPNLVMIGLSRAAPTAAQVRKLAERATAGEQLRVVGDALWIFYPEGSGRSKLAGGLIDRAVGSPVTTRNWRTVLKLEDLAAEVGDAE